MTFNPKRLASLIMWSPMAFAQSNFLPSRLHRLPLSMAPSSSAATITTDLTTNHHNHHQRRMHQKKLPNIVALQIRGGASEGNLVQSAAGDLVKYLAGSKKDTLLMLALSAVIPSFSTNILKLSPILGYIAAGTLLGPNVLNVVSDTHAVEHLGELGIVFFLFEIGVELSPAKLMEMKNDVFGLGLSQFLLTTFILTLVGTQFFKQSSSLSFVVAGALALSSSAFVLQLLKDNNTLETRHGQASFGTLLLQDLAVVPMLVITPLLANQGGASTSGSPVAEALVKAAMALSGIAVFGKGLLRPLFEFVNQVQTQEVFLAVLFLTVMSCSYLTEGLGLSNTLGAFLAGVLLSESKWKHQVEESIATFRALLLGLFFTSVGFDIDLGLILNEWKTIGGLLIGLVGLKGAIVKLLGRGFGLTSADSTRSASLLGPGSEFAFVILGLAKNVGLIEPTMTKLLLTTVSLSMAVTPSLYDMAS